MPRPPPPRTWSISMRRYEVGIVGAGSRHCRRSPPTAACRSRARWSRPDRCGVDHGGERRVPVSGSAAEDAVEERAELAGGDVARRPRPADARGSARPRGPARRSSTVMAATDACAFPLVGAAVGVPGKGLRIEARRRRGSADRRRSAGSTARVCARSRSTGSGSKRGSVRARRRRSIVASRVSVSIVAESWTSSSLVAKPMCRREVLEGGGEGGGVELARAFVEERRHQRRRAPAAPRGRRSAPPRKLALDREDRKGVVLVEPGLDPARRGHRDDVDLGARPSAPVASARAKRDEERRGSRRQLPGRISPAASASL